MADDAKEYILGAPSAAIGDPTGSMMDLGQLPSATISLDSSRAYASDVGGHQQAEGAVDRGVMATCELELYDAQHAVLTSLLGSAQDDGEGGIAFNTTARPLTPRAICVIENGNEEDAISKDNWWIVAADDNGSLDLNYTDSEGEDANESYTVSFQALKAEKDQGGGELPPEAQKIFKGQPATHGLSSWTLPAKYTVSAG